MNYVYGSIAVILMLLGIEQYGEHRIQVQWDLEKARLETISQQNAEQDKKAREAIEKQHQKDIEYAKSQAGRDAISAWLKSHSLLPDGTPVSSSSSSQTKSSQGSNESTCQCGTSQHIEEFAGRCAQDALTVLHWQEWSIREGLEVE